MSKVKVLKKKSRINWVILCLAIYSFICFLCYGLQQGMPDLDFIQQAYIGQEIVQNGNFYGSRSLLWGTQDINVYYNHEWLATILFYFSKLMFNNLGSIYFINILFAFLLSLCLYFFLSYIEGKKQITNFATICCYGFLIWFFAIYLFTLKICILSVCLFVCLLLLLEMYKTADISFKRFSCFLILITLLWNNLHSSSVILVFIVSGLYWLCCWRELKSGLLLVGNLLTLCINPYGFNLIKFNIEHMTDGFMYKLIVDWESLRFDNYASFLIYICMCIIGIALFNCIKTDLWRDNIVYVCLFIVFVALTISAKRHYMYLFPIGLLICSKGAQLKGFEINKLTGLYVVTLSIVCLFLLIDISMFYSNMTEYDKQVYEQNQASPELIDCLAQTVAKNNEGFFVIDFNVWDLGYKSFLSHAFTETQDRAISKYLLYNSSDYKIYTIIDYYHLDKFLIRKEVVNSIDLVISNNLYDYLMARPDIYTPIYEDDKYIYIVDNEIYKAMNDIDK